MAREEGRKIIANYRPGMEDKEHLKLSTKEAHDPQLKPLSSLAEDTCRAARPPSLPCRMIHTHTQANLGTE